jgi:uncharacterized protein YdaT
MPFSAESYRKRHNKALTDAGASKGAEMANAMIREGVDEGTAIATANKHVEGQKKKGRYEK